MADTNVKVVYSEFSDNSVAQEIEFELLTDVILNIKYDTEQKGVVMTMSDKITDNTELTGLLDEEKLAVLIKSLNQMRRQLKTESEV